MSGIKVQGDSTLPDAEIMYSLFVGRQFEAPSLEQAASIEQSDEYKCLQTLLRDS
jgi:hypothetical protein